MFKLQKLIILFLSFFISCRVVYAFEIEEKTIYDSRGHLFKDLVMTDDGEYYAVGASYLPTMSLSTITKLDSDGNSVWTKLPSSYKFIYNSVIETKSEKLLAVGTTGARTLFDKEGTEIWHFNSQLTTDKYNEVIELKEKYVAVGNVLTVFDENGTIIKSQTLPTIEYIGIEKLPNEELIVVGFEKNIDTGSKTIIVEKYNENLESIWKQRYNNEDSVECQDFVIDEENNIVIVGLVEEINNSKYKPIVVKIDLNGQFINSHKFNQEISQTQGNYMEISYDIRPYARILNKNKGFVISLTSNNNSIIMKVNKNYKVQKQIQTNNTTNEVNDLITNLIDTDNGIVATVLRIKYDHIINDENYFYENDYINLTDVHYAEIKVLNFLYNINKKESINGTYHIINEGENYKIDIVPEDGYELENVSIKDSNGNIVEISDDYTFELYDDIQISVQFKKSILNPNTKTLIIPELFILAMFIIFVINSLLKKQIQKY